MYYDCIYIAISGTPLYAKLSSLGIYLQSILITRTEVEEISVLCILAYI